jgi:hypothetical protein
MASKLTTGKKAMPKDLAATRLGNGNAKAAPSKRRRAGPMVSPYPIPPRELAGKWVAWSRYKIVASGDTLAGVIAQVKSGKMKEVSYELLPGLERGH